MKRWFVPALGAALVGMVAASPAVNRVAAQPADTQSWDVQVGAGDEETHVAAQAFLPGVLTVRAGDTVRWNRGPGEFGFHTITFNAGRPRLSIIEPGPGAGELQLGPAVFPFPPGPTPPSGAYDGTSQVSSGTPSGEGGDVPPPFTLTFTTPGFYPYECAIHPGMAGAVQVLPAGSQLAETPAQAAARGQAEASELIAGGAQLTAMITPPAAASNTGTVRTVTAGVGSAHGITVFKFLPGDLTVKRGDTVVFSMADPFEIHTVTFPGSGPAPEFIDVRPQPAGPPQLVIPAQVALPVGDNRFDGEGLANSGILGPGQAWVVTVDAPAGSYEYLCVVHPFMKATVTVVD